MEVADITGTPRSAGTRHPRASQSTRQLHWQGRLIGGTAGTGTCTNESVPGCVCMVCMRIARKQDLAGYMYACASPGNIPSTTRQRPQVFTLDTKSLGLGGFAAFLLTIVDGQGRKLTISTSRIWMGCGIKPQTGLAQPWFGNVISGLIFS